MAVDVTVNVTPTDVVTTIAPTNIIATVSESVAGPAGPPGTLSVFTFNQPTGSQSWVINHGGGVRPVVITVDINDKEMFGDVTFVSNTQVRVDFANSVAGKAYLYI